MALMSLEIYQRTFVFIGELHFSSGDSMNPFRLDGQRALITGGGTGIGLAMAQAMAEAGARVILTGRRAERLQAACAEIGERANAIPHDINDLASIPALIEKIEADFGPVDTVVNNAGVHLKKPMVDTTDAEFLSVIQTHVLGAFALSRECAQRMVARGSGSILNIVSMTALFGMPLAIAYSTAKTALLGQTRALAVELSPLGIRVNAIAPGYIHTPMSDRAFANDPARMQKAMGRTPMGKRGDPMDVGYAAVYLSSPAAQYITGVILPVDGGTSIGF
jgi:gluconate 5-dehydrogenase